MTHTRLTSKIISISAAALIFTCERASANVCGTGVVFDYSDSRHLTQQEIQSITSKWLRISRNEIPARRGYIFKDQNLQAYFVQMGWYLPITRNAEALHFNSAEAYNMKLIKDEEARRASTGVSPTQDPQECSGQAPTFHTTWEQAQAALNSARAAAQSEKLEDRYKAGCVFDGQAGCPIGTVGAVQIGFSPRGSSSLSALALTAMEGTEEGRALLGAERMRWAEYKNAEIKLEKAQRALNAASTPSDRQHAQMELYWAKNTVNNVTPQYHDAQLKVETYAKKFILDQ